MGTRCFIGIEMESFAIVGIYNHYDGYLSGVGATLLQHYDVETKVWKLIGCGDRSSLGDIPERGLKLTKLADDDADTYSNGPYNLEDAVPRFEISVEAIFAHQSDFEYAYVYSHKLGKWQYATYNDSRLKDLTFDEIKKEDE